MNEGLYGFPPGETASPWRPRYKRGLYFGGNAITLTTGQARTNGLITAMSVEVAKPTPIDQLAIYVGTFATTGTLRLGIYADDGSCFPGSVFYDAGTVTAMTPTNVKSIAVSLTLSPGVWWFACLPEFTGTLTVEGPTNPFPWPHYRTAPGAAFANGFYATGIVSPLPNPWPGPISLTLGNPSFVMARAA